MNYQFENINEAQLYFIKEILYNGNQVITRNMKTKELAPAVFTVLNPTNRITTLKERKWNFSGAIGELIWHLSGSNDLNIISHYLKQWECFSADGKKIYGSCYGHKIFKPNSNGESRWQNIIKLLKSDSGSRRAVINLGDNIEEETDELIDVSCTSTLQFLIRNAKLDMIVNMRSNDIIWGLPYDFFVFSFFQELLSKILNCKVGKYTHFASSLHLYELHFNLAEKIIAADSYEEILMPPLNNFADLKKVFDLENKLRNSMADIETILKENIDHYWKEILKVVYFNHRKRLGDSTNDLSTLKKQSIYVNAL